MFLNNELIINSEIGRQTHKQSLESLQLFLHNSGMLQTNNQQRSIQVTQNAWQEMYGQIIELRQRIPGADILEDLNGRASPIPVGKFVGTYQKLSGMTNTTTVSIDGGNQAVYNHVDYDQDGDPIVVFKEGYGANWRLVESLRTVDLDVLLDSQRQASHNFNATVVNYMLNGDANINFDGYTGEGLFTHRNTAKVNLGAAGFNINLTTATPVQLSDFFGKFKGVLNDNYVMRLDILWVSPEIMSNLTQSMAIVSGGDYGGNLGETVLDYLKAQIPSLDVRESFGLKDNQFFGYVRSGIRIRVGMPTTITALPRPTPNSNHNFELLAVQGVNVMSDALGHKEAFFGGEFS